MARTSDEWLLSNSREQKVSFCKHHLYKLSFHLITYLHEILNAPSPTGSETPSLHGPFPHVEDILCRVTCVHFASQEDDPLSSDER